VNKAERVVIVALAEDARRAGFTSPHLDRLERIALAGTQPIQGRPKVKQDPPELVEAKKVVRRRSRGICEVGSEVCTGEAQHFHHRKMRSAGGSHSERNGLDSCWACHDFLHANPDLSYEHGWLLHSWENEGREVTG
jgi:hypothetical protein